MEYEILVKFMNEDGTTTIISTDEIVDKCQLKLHDGTVYNAQNLTILHSEESFDFTDMATDDYVGLDFDEVASVTRLNDSEQC